MHGAPRRGQQVPTGQIASALVASFLIASLFVLSPRSRVGPGAFVTSDQKCMLGVGASARPRAGQQLVEPALGMILDAGDDVGEVAPIRWAQYDRNQERIRKNAFSNLPAKRSPRVADVHC